MDPIEPPDCFSHSLAERVSCAVSFLLRVMPKERECIEAVACELQCDFSLLPRYATAYELLDTSHYNSLSIAAFKMLDSMHRQDPSLFFQSVKGQSFPDFMLQTFEPLFRGYYVRRYSDKVRAHPMNHA